MVDLCVARRGQLSLHPVAAADQWRALDAVLATVAPDALALPPISELEPL